MQNGRRTDGRRRRVLYTSHHADSSTPTAASRREAARLREARKPTAAYGARVHRRLRGRWFSIVPVRRRTLTIAASIIAAFTLTLCLAHYWSVTKPSLVYNPEIARPLRLDRADSFGQWLLCVLLAGCSGASLLIYQLRRYRNDDYRGQYRLWRLVLVLLMIASVHSLTGLVSWGGALLDAMLGKRVALTGGDWLRLVVSIGCTILALRLIAEVRRSRWALVGLLLACAFFAIPEAVKWNVLSVETVAMDEYGNPIKQTLPGRWALVTAAPLLGSTALFLALTGYLRMLYREVRQIEDEPLAIRFQELKARMFQRDRDEEEQDEPERRRRRWFARGSKRGPAEEEYEDDDVVDEYEEEEDEYEYEEEEAAEDDAEDVVEEQPRRKRRWFGIRAAKPDASDEIDEEDDPVDEVAESKPKKRSRWSLRLNPANRSEPDNGDQETSADEPEDAERPKRRFGLSWRRKPSEANEQDAGEEPESQQQSYSSDGDEYDDDYIDPDEIDWDTLSKSERRRLRKKLKRQRRAA